MSKNKTTAKKVTPVVSPEWMLLIETCEKGLIEKVNIDTFKRRNITRNAEGKMESSYEKHYNVNITLDSQFGDKVNFDFKGETIEDCIRKIFSKKLIERMEVSHEQK